MGGSRALCPGTRYRYRGYFREDQQMSKQKVDQRKGDDRRSDEDRRDGSEDRRVKQDPTWLGERDRRKGSACRRETDDRRKGTDRRKEE